MSFHPCPIEPDDWANGPHEDPECRHCEGTGEIINENGQQQTCSYCKGSGFADDYDGDNYP